MSLLRQAQADPVGWLRAAFGGELWERQQEIIRSFFRERVTLVPSCHASGKSFTAARAFLGALYLHPDCKVISTATTWHQVESILWAEIRAAHARAKIPLGGPAPLTTSIELAPTWLGFGVSTNNPVSMQGQHAVGGVFFIVDEGDGIEADIWEGIKANLSTGDCHLLVIGNPVDPESKMAAMCGDPENSVLRISAFDTPNFTAFGLTLEDFRSDAWKRKIDGRPMPAPWLISPQWVADVMREEGEESPFFVSRVLALWPDVGEDALIKQAWIEKAWAKWPGADEKGPHAIGHDVARYGDDKTVSARRRGEKFWVEAVGSGMDSEKAAEQALRMEALDNVERRGRTPIFVDVAGVGAGVYDLLKKSTRAIPVDNAERAEDPERFVNRRAENYWNFRELLRTGRAALNPSDRALAQELRAVRFRINKGRVQIEEKDEIKKRIGRSPDRADAVVLAACGHAGTTVGFLEAMKAAQGVR